LTNVPLGRKIPRLVPSYQSPSLDEDLSRRSALKRSEGHVLGRAGISFDTRAPCVLVPPRPLHSGHEASPWNGLAARRSQRPWPSRPWALPSPQASVASRRPIYTSASPRPRSA